MTLSAQATMRAAPFLLALAALACPAAALAKEPSKASIAGPGVSTPITISGDGGTTGTPLGQLTEQTGFAPAVFGHRDPDPMSPKRPKGDLGPRYTVTYTVPGPDNDSWGAVEAASAFVPGGPWPRDSEGLQHQVLAIADADFAQAREQGLGLTLEAAAAEALD